MRLRRPTAHHRGPGDATVVLGAEHQVILGVVGALRRVLDGGGRLADAAFWSQAVTFLRAFVERHDAKEEDVLLPHLSAHGVSTTDESFRLIAADHERGRELLDAMAALAPRLAGTSPAEREQFRRAAAEYCELLPRHIAYESGVLIPLMEELISPDDARELMQRFRLSEHVANGEDEYDRLLMVAEQLRRAA